MEQKIAVSVSAAHEKNYLEKNQRIFLILAFLFLIFFLLGTILIKGISAIALVIMLKQFYDIKKRINYLRGEYDV